jgi:DNA-binding MarR family transcriptional regulator
MAQRWLPQTPHDEVVMETLRSIRALNDAMDRMNGDVKGDMDMNATDLAALRMLIVREQRNESVSPHDIAKHLRISTASTTKLLDRLTASGHVMRKPHPSDRRARIVELTADSRAEFFKRFGIRLAAMRDIAREYSAEELQVIQRFMGEVSAAIDPA